LISKQRLSKLEMVVMVRLIRYYVLKLFLNPHLIPFLGNVSFMNTKEKAFAGPDGGDGGNGGHIIFNG